MSARYSIRLSVVDRRGLDEWHMAVDSDEFPIFSERFVDEMRAPVDAGFSLVSFDTAVSALKERKFRRDLLLHAAKRLEDKEGWHGEKRRETTKAIGR